MELEDKPTTSISPSLRLLNERAIHKSLFSCDYKRWHLLKYTTYIKYSRLNPTGVRPHCWKKKTENNFKGNSLAVQWLGLHAFTTADRGSVPDWGTKIPQALQCGQNKDVSARIQAASSPGRTSVCAAQGAAGVRACSQLCLQVQCD